MFVSIRFLPRAIALWGGTYAIVGGQHALSAFLLNSILNPELPSPPRMAALLSMIVVQLAVAAFWLPLGQLVHRLGGSLLVLRVCVYTALAAGMLRVVAEVAGGALIGAFPVLLVSSVIVGAAVLLGHKPAPARRAVRGRDAGMMVLPGGGLAQARRDGETVIEPVELVPKAQ